MHLLKRMFIFRQILALYLSNLYRRICMCRYFAMGGRQPHPYSFRTTNAIKNCVCGIALHTYGLPHWKPYWCDCLPPLALNNIYKYKYDVMHSRKWDFEHYCSNKGLAFLKNRSAYFCPQISVRLNKKSGRLL